MSVPLEHDYIGWSEDSSSMEGRSSGKISPSSTLSSEDEKNNALNFKATELRLGLPGSESPERKSLFGISLFGKDLEEKTCGYSLIPPLKGFVSGSKRGFSDTMEGSGKWALSGIAGSEADLGGNGNLFSPRGLKTGAETCKKEVAVVVPPPKPLPEKKKSLVTAPAAKAQVVGWPPVRSFRKNTMASNSAKNNVDDDAKSAPGCVYVKVSMDGAPYLRKVDLKTYSNYVQLSSALEKMFSCFTIGQCSSQGSGDGLSERHLKDLIHGSEYVLTYEDKDGDWMLVGDVPWEMFTNTCKRLRIMKGSEAIGLAPRATEKCKNR